MRDDRLRPPDALLAAVARDLQPVRPAPLPFRQALLAIPFALLAFGAVLVFVGLRGDMAKLGPLAAWGASIVQLAAAVILVWMAARESTPGHRLPKVIVRIALAAAWLVVAGITLWTFDVRPISIPARFSAWRAGVFCGVNGTLVGILLMFPLAYIFGRSLAARPWLVGALAGAGAGISVNAGWRLACPVSSPSHALLAHGAPVVLMTILGAVLVSWIARRRSRAPQSPSPIAAGN